MNSGAAKAFTLIEMLIVVAIITILSTGLIAYVTVPPREQLQATADMEIESGLLLLFSHLVSDTHNASSLTFFPQERLLVLDAPATQTVALYFVNDKHALRRCVTSTPSPAQWPALIESSHTFAASNQLLANVKSFDAAQTENGRWRINISVETKDQLRPIIDRSVELSLGVLSGSLAEKGPNDG